MTNSMRIIRQSAFNTEHSLLRGNLHLHTSRSDGQLSPDEAVRKYAENGYDFVALTDHSVYNRESYAPETGMVIIPGVEVHTLLEEAGAGERVYHSVFLGEDNESNGFLHDERILIDNVKSQEEFQKYLDLAYSKNNIAFYSHPEWSQTPPRYFDKMKGLAGIEIWNTASSYRDYDINAPYWDDLLGQGMRLAGIAVDDAHKEHQYLGGWIMVNAEKNVPSILSAIKNGAFYSSCGPVIKNFYFDGKHAVAETEEECEKIFICSDKHKHKVGENSSFFETEIADDCQYIRAVVKDKHGKRAWTNPIYLK